MPFCVLLFGLPQFRIFPALVGLMVENNMIPILAEPVPLLATLATQVAGRDRTPVS